MRADARQKRQQLIEAAVENFRTRPSSEVTLGEIAADAGVGIATLYRHFPTRTDLREACALHFIDTLDGWLSETLDTFHTDPAAKFEGFVWKCVDAGIGMLVGALASEKSPDQHITERRDQFFAHVQQLLDRAAEHRLVDPSLKPAELASELIVVTRPMSAGLQELFPDVRERLVEHLLVAWRGAR